MMPGLEAFRLDGQVAVVTGAGGLLGPHHCAALAEAGALVVAVEPDLERAAAAKRAASEAVVERIHPWALDVCDETAVQAACAAVAGRWGRVQVLLNNAALNDKVEDPVSASSAASVAAHASALPNFPLALFERYLRINLSGTFLMCKHFGAHMAAAGGGSIINVASTYALVGPDQRLYRDRDGKQRFFKSVAYPASKAGVLGLTRALATYWGEQGVRVNTLTPGGVDGGQDADFAARYAARTPLGRMAQPEDYRGAVLFLASAASGYMTGGNLVVDGGWTAW
ncbi:MAG: SDR family oxidoreductase [Polyangiales bacterium]